MRLRLVNQATGQVVLVGEAGEGVTPESLWESMHLMRLRVERDEEEQRDDEEDDEA